MDNSLQFLHISLCNIHIQKVDAQLFLLVYYRPRAISSNNLHVCSTVHRKRLTHLFLSFLTNTRMNCLYITSPVRYVYDPAFTCAQVCCISGTYKRCMFRTKKKIWIHCFTDLIILIQFSMVVHSRSCLRSTAASAAVKWNEIGSVSPRWVLRKRVRCMWLDWRVFNVCLHFCFVWWGNVRI